MAKIERKLIVDRYISWGHYQRMLVKDPNSDCINWTGSINNAGYGMIGFFRADKTKGMMTPHRLALMIKLGREIQPGMNANHTCHNRTCCNPDHLVEGTQTQKMKDMYKDGLLKIGKGVPGPRTNKQNRQYKYSEQDISWIRTADPKDIAQKYNMKLDAAKRFQYQFRIGYKWLPYEK